MRRAAALAFLAWACWSPAAAASSVYAFEDRVVVWDAVGEANGIQLTRAPDGRLSVVDSAGVSVAGGCEAVDAHTALCPMPAKPVEVGLGRDKADLHPNALVAGPGVAVAVYGSNAADHVSGGPGVDHVRGYDGADRLDGGGGNDEIDAGAGNDVVLGGDGEDRLAGGGGDDDLDGGAELDVLDGGPGRDRVLYDRHPTGVRVTLSENLEGATDRTTTFETVIGSPHADEIQGSDHDDLLVGGGGDDRIGGLRGADRIDGGDGDDWLFGDADAGVSPADLPTAHGGSDQIAGGPGADHLRGDAARDALDGGAGADTVDGREAESTQEALDDTVTCGADADLAKLDWNDEARDCEELQVRPRPDVSRPPPALPQATGPGPQPILGVPAILDGAVFVPVHCGSARGCSVRVLLWETRATRVRGRRRSRIGARLALRTATLPANTTQPVRLPLPARARRGRGRLMVELRIGSRRWQRPLTLGS